MNLLIGLGVWTLLGFCYVWATALDRRNAGPYTLPAILLSTAALPTLWVNYGFLVALIGTGVLVIFMFALGVLVPTKHELVEGVVSRVKAAESRGRSDANALRALDAGRRFLWLASREDRARFHRERAHLLASMGRVAECLVESHKAANYGAPVALVESAEALLADLDTQSEAKTLLDAALRSPALTPEERGRAVALVLRFLPPTDRFAIASRALAGQSMEGFPVVLPFDIETTIAHEVGQETLRQGGAQRAVELAHQALRRLGSGNAPLKQDLLELLSQAYERLALDAFGASDNEAFLAVLRELTSSGGQTSQQCFVALARYWHTHGERVLAQIACFAAKAAPLGPVMRNPPPRPARAEASASELSEIADTLGVVDLHERSLPKARALVETALKFPARSDRRVFELCFEAWDQGFEASHADLQAALARYQSAADIAGVDIHALRWVADHLRSASFGQSFDSLATKCEKLAEILPVFESAFAEEDRSPIANEVYEAAIEILRLAAGNERTALERRCRDAMKACAQLQTTSAQIRAWHWIGLARIFSTVGELQLCTAAMEAAISEGRRHQGQSLGHLEFLEKLYYWSKDLAFAKDFADNVRSSAISLATSMTAPFRNQVIQMNPEIEAASDAGHRITGKYPISDAHRRPRESGTHASSL